MAHSRPSNPTARRRVAAGLMAGVILASMAGPVAAVDVVTGYNPDSDPGAE